MFIKDINLKYLLLYIKLKNETFIYKVRHL